MSISRTLSSLLGALILLSGFLLQPGSHMAAAAGSQTGPQDQRIEMVFQQGMNGYTGAEDVEISSWYPDMNRNFYWEDTIHIRANDKTAGLYRFDLSQVPQQAVVVQATFSVLATGRYGEVMVDMDAYQVNRAWQADEATWNQANQSQAIAWDTAGCNGTPGDRAAFPQSHVTMSDTLTWYDMDVTTMAQSWVADPSTNHGLILKSFSPVGGMWLACAEHGGPDNHPKLTLRLDLSEVTPSPTPTTTPTETLEPGRHVVTLQQGMNGYAGCADTRILAPDWVSDPSNNYGDEDILTVRADDKMASLIRFELSPLPDQAEVITASLQVYAYARQVAERTLNVEAYKVLRPWEEMAATWEQATAEMAWAGAGCNGENVDRAPWPAASAPLSDIPSWYAFDLSALVREWAAQPDSNHGVVLKSFDLPQEFGLYSADHGYAARRPRLRIAYILDEPSPTPPTTGTVTATPTASATETATDTVTPTVTETPTATISATPTHTNTVTPTDTATLTATHTATDTATPTVTNTPTDTPSPTPYQQWLPLLLK